jgi:ketosteroid isomerase-like protein
VPQENEDLARRAYAALQRDDIESFLAFVDPGVEWHSLVLEVEGVRHGHDGVRSWWHGLRSAFGEWNPSLVGVWSHGDWVVIHAHATGSGAASGAGIDNDFWQAVRLRDALVVEYHALRTEGEALAVVGLQ